MVKISLISNGGKCVSSDQGSCGRSSQPRKPELVTDLTRERFSHQPKKFVVAQHDTFISFPNVRGLFFRGFTITILGFLLDSPI